jgi:hypothetical protein
VSQGSRQIDLTVHEEKISLAGREEKVGLVSEVTLTAIETELRAEGERVRLLSGRTDINLRRRVANWLLGLFTLNTAGALAVIFLVGFGKMGLSDKVIMSVLGATVVQAAAMLVTVTKYLFPTRTSQDT